MAKQTGSDGQRRRGFWHEEITKALSRWSGFHASGVRVVDQYRIESADEAVRHSKGQDKFNILYSSTETIRPSLYAQTPKVEARQRHRDRKNPMVTAAVQVIEAGVQYAMEEVDFDDVMENVIEDYTLPGLGCAWVRYIPTITKDENNVESVSYEELGLDYVYWKDFLTSGNRVWKETWWVARRVYLTKAEATARFGKEKANRVQYRNQREKSAGDDGQGDDECIVWEIWNKRDKSVIWYSPDYADDVLDVKADPLKLKGFYPTPKPMRAISNTRTMVPRPFYSQYQAQADELNNLTTRIRLLTDALNVRGVYHGGEEKLATLLAKHGGNKMLAVQDWISFAQGGGLKGMVDFLPLQPIVEALMKLYEARNQVKSEIYEITGFSDIVRGSSKASETLGAQQIKTDWASARLKKMQKEVQRYARDLVRIMSEVMVERFQVATLAMYAGFDVPEGADAAPAAQQFEGVIKLLRTERERCANIGIETDSTILPDEDKERKDRMEFLGAAGAFLQQAGPMVMQYPDMRELLGGMMMFTIRTFRASRPLEAAFEAFQEKLAQQPATDPNAKEGGDNGAAALQTAQIKAQTDMQIAQMNDATKRYELDQRQALEMQKAQAEAQASMIELEIKKIELQIKQEELQIERMRLQAEQQQAQFEAEQQQREGAMQEQQHAQDMELKERQQSASEQQQVHSQQQDVQTGERENKKVEQAARTPPKKTT